MERRKILELGSEGGSIVYEELILEGKTSYIYKVSESNIADNETDIEPVRPLYDSFEEVLSNSTTDIFMLSPEYIDPTIWNELSEMFTNYCDAKEIDMFSKHDWTKALGIHDTSAVFEGMESLGLSQEDAFQLCDIICKIQMHDEREAELEEILEDPFLHEGGGPGTRELLLMLAKQVQG